jgi:hypothetical protein
MKLSAAERRVMKKVLARARAAKKAKSKGKGRK